MQISIRQAKDEDRDRLVVLKHYWGNYPAEEYIEHRLRKMRQGEAVYLVAEHEGRIVGHVFLKFYGTPTAPDYPNIEDLYAHPDFRRRGIATALLRQCEQLAKTHGFTAIGLAAGVDENGPARWLYHRLGYERTGSEPYVDGVYNGVEDWVVDMCKTL
jgi:GNAT superfamily N-acetyltransferase